MKRLIILLLGLAIVAGSAAQTPTTLNGSVRYQWPTPASLLDSTNFASQNRTWYGQNQDFRFTHKGAKYGLSSYIAAFAPAILGTTFWKLAGTSTVTGDALINSVNHDIRIHRSSPSSTQESEFYSIGDGGTDSTGIINYSTSGAGYAALKLQGGDNIHMIQKSADGTSESLIAANASGPFLSFLDGSGNSNIIMQSEHILVSSTAMLFDGISYDQSYRNNFSSLSLVDAGYVINFAKTYTQKQTFAGATTVAGANFANSADMSSGLADGDFRYNTTSDRWVGRTNGSILPFAQGPASSTAFGIPYFTNTSGGALASTGVGTAGEVLTSNGPGVAPTFQPAGGGGGWAVTGTTTLTGTTTIDADGNDVTIGTATGPQLGILSNQVFLTKGDPNGYGFVLGTTDQAFATGAEVYLQADGGNESIELSATNGISMSSGSNKIALGGEITLNEPVHDDTVEHILTWDYDDHKIKMLHKSDLGGLSGSIANVTGTKYQVAFSDGTNQIKGDNKFSITNGYQLFVEDFSDADIAGVFGPTALIFSNQNAPYSTQAVYSQSGIVASNPGAADFNIESSDVGVTVEAIRFNDTGIDNNSAGLKHSRVSQTINGSSEEDVTITWSTAFSDASYTVQATVETTDAGSSINGPVSCMVIEKTTTTVVVRVFNQSTNDFPGIVHVTAIHN
jgi:hypothetical protein